MTEQGYTRRTAVRRVGAGLLMSTLPTGAAPPVNGDSSIPTLERGTTETLSLDEMDRGDVHASPVDTDFPHTETATIGPDRIELYADQSSPSFGTTFTHKALIAKCFGVTTNTEVTVSVTMHGGVKGALEAQSGTQASVTGLYGVFECDLSDWEHTSVSELALASTPVVSVSVEGSEAVIEQSDVKKDMRIAVEESTVLAAAGYLRADHTGEPPETVVDFRSRGSNEDRATPFLDGGFQIIDVACEIV